MAAGEKLIMGQTTAELHAGWAQDATREHEQASNELTSWLQYLSAEEIRGLVSTAKTAAKAEIARRQGPYQPSFRTDPYDGSQVRNG